MWLREREMSDKVTNWMHQYYEEQERMFSQALKETKEKMNLKTERKKMTKMIEILVYPAKAEPYRTQIPNTLKALQKVVGGLIEVIRHPATEVLTYAFGGKPVILLANEEGLLHDLPPNQNIGGIVGDCFFMLDADFE